jgi:UDP-N-acetylmuramyl pentapeptide phosphotransferase/UDP-N-acetylglucosamine-1-phosphate transferase
MAAALTDAPNLARKTHKAPTPTGGGLGAAVGVGVGMALLPLAGPEPGLAAALSLAAALMALGLLDDLVSPPASLKFAAIAALSLIFAIWGARVDAIGLLDAGTIPLGAAQWSWPDRTLALPALLAIAGTALWLFTLTNAVNFMDGANGLAMGSTALGAMGLAALAVLQGASDPAMAALMLAAGLAGFLVWNAPSGRLFAGDAGSLFAGGLSGGVGVVAVQEAGVSVWAAALCFLPILADVLLTLAHRARRGRNLLKGHREHLYQIALRAGTSHRRIALLYAFLTLHCVLCAAAGSLFGDFGALAAFLVNVLIALRLSARVRAYAAEAGLDAEV